MRYEVVRMNQPTVTVEADNYRVQEYGSSSDVFGTRRPGQTIYTFYKCSSERYGSDQNVASYMDVRSVRELPATPDAAQPKVAEAEPAETVN